ncbi:type IV pilus assembly PilZ [Desulfovibrio sp. X2]|uniref:tetratricopeptide repeat protein n=1 Tax=Desulfovibrio sp. X2 TaxID=941449 RepID=UPI000358AA18|nr:tetratricopeptide repeat protein [Desulfovibrio sp. X2]EPR44466.1 type IV pilus assembly PilZ [Desulfovibrio sp. X2]
MPRILGVYYSEKTDHVGEGGTRKAVVTRVYWFVLRSDEEGYLIQPLNAENMPAGFTKRVSRADFLRDFVPDPGHYSEHVESILERLRSRIGRNEGYVDLSGLERKERLMFKALQAADRRKADAAGGGQADGAAKGAEEGDGPAPQSGAAAAGQRLAKELLAALPNMGEVSFDFTCEVNARSIELRKEGDYEAAIHHYRKALRLNPEDDHLLFNLARACWHSGEKTACAEYLGKALALNPEFEQARLFLDFVARKLKGKGAAAATSPDAAPQGGAESGAGAAAAEASADAEAGDVAAEDVAAEDVVLERRAAPRVVLDVEVRCTVVGKGGECEHLVRDLSLSGALLELSPDMPQPVFRKGEKVMLMPQEGLVGELMGTRKAEIVWCSGRRFGICFTKPLSTGERSLEECLGELSAEE